MVWNEEDILEGLELIEEVSEADLLEDEAEIVMLSQAGQEPSKVSDEEKCPMTTVTMAELFVSQGFLKRAFTIYRELLDADPGNSDLKNRLYGLKAAIDEDNATARCGTMAGSDGEDRPDVTGCEAAVAAPMIAEDPGPTQDPNVVVATLEKWLHAIERRR